MYSINNNKNSGYKRFIPLFSFASILFLSVLLSGSAMLPQNGISDPAAYYSNIRVNYNFAGADLNHVLRQVSLDHNIKIFSCEQMDGKITANFCNVPLNEMLSKIFKNMNYSYRLCKDGIIIEKRQYGGAKSGSAPMKRVFIAPSFVGIKKVKEIIERFKSSDAQVTCDEKSGVAVIDENPEVADLILEKIREIDVYSEKTEADSRTHLETKLFVLKNSSISDVIGDIKSKLSKDGSVFPNENLSSIIVTDTFEVLEDIEKLINFCELNSGSPVVTFKVIQLPAAISADLKKAGYNIDNQCAAGGLKLSKIANRKQFHGILENYVKSIGKLSSESNEFVEIMTSYENISSKIKVFSEVGKSGKFRATVRTHEELKFDAESRPFDKNMFRTAKFETFLSENDCIVITGFEKTAADILKSSALPDGAAYIPGLDKIYSKRGDRHENDSAKNVVAISIEIEASKNNRGMPKYTFLNLLHLAGSETAAGESEKKDDGLNYLGMFSRPAGQDKNSKVRKEQPANNGTIADGGEENERGDDVAAEKGLVRKENSAAGDEENLGGGTSAFAGAPGKKVADGKKSTADMEKTAISNVKKLIKSEKYSKAEKEAKKYLEDNPESVEMLIALGNVYKDTKKFISAKNAWEQALSVDKENGKLKENIDKLDNLISLIKAEKAKVKGGDEIKEFEAYLR